MLKINFLKFVVPVLCLNVFACAVKNDIYSFSSEMYEGFFKINDHGWYITKNKQEPFTDIVLLAGVEHKVVHYEFHPTLNFTLFKIDLKNEEIKDSINIQYLAVQENLKSFNNWVINLPTIYSNKGHNKTNSNAFNHPLQTPLKKKEFKIFGKKIEEIKLCNSGFSLSVNEIKINNAGQTILIHQHNSEDFYKNIWSNLKERIINKITQDIIIINDKKRSHYESEYKHKVLQKTLKEYNDLNSNSSELDIKIQKEKDSLTTLEDLHKIYKSFYINRSLFFNEATDNMKQDAVEGLTNNIEQLKQELDVIKDQKNKLEEILGNPEKIWKIKSQKLDEKRKNLTLLVQEIYNLDSDYSTFDLNMKEKILTCMNEYFPVFSLCFSNNMNKINDNGLIISISKGLRLANKKYVYYPKLVGIIDVIKDDSTLESTRTIIDFTKSEVQQWIHHTIACKSQDSPNKKRKGSTTELDFCNMKKSVN